MDQTQIRRAIGFILRCDSEEDVRSLIARTLALEPGSEKHEALVSYCEEVPRGPLWGAELGEDNASAPSTKALSLASRSSTGKPARASITMSVILSVTSLDLFTISPPVLPATSTL